MCHVSTTQPLLFNDFFPLTPPPYSQVKFLFFGVLLLLIVLFLNKHYVQTQTFSMGSMILNLLHVTLHYKSISFFLSKISTPFILSLFPPTGHHPTHFHLPGWLLYIAKTKSRKCLWHFKHPNEGYRKNKFTRKGRVKRNFRGFSIQTFFLADG